MLELTFISILAALVVATGLFALVVVSRVAEPRGARALLRRLTGRA